MNRKLSFGETTERMQLSELFAKDICSVSYRNVCHGQFPSTIVLPKLKLSQNVIYYIEQGLRI